jgi:hypothetical protein
VSGGLFLDAYALAKQLPAPWLRDELGLRDVELHGRPAVAIPYRDQGGRELTVRYRVALHGDAKRKPFLWPKGTRAKGLVYGLEHRKHAVAAGRVLLNEGESDVQTALFHGFPAFGIPGVSCFDDDLTSPAFEGIDELVFIQEPGEAAAGLLEALRRSRLAARIHVVTLGEHKDISALHLALAGDREAFRAAIEEALERAEPLTLSAGETSEREPFRIEVLSAKALSELPTPDEEPELVGPFLRRGRITLLGATTGHGKTTFGAQMLAAGVLGGDFLGWSVEGGLRALVLDLEQHLEDIREQLQAVGLAGSELIDYAPLPEGLQIDRDEEQLAELERVVAAKPYDIVRIDPFYKLHAADSSEELQARELVRLTRRWVNRHGFALLMDTHTRKRIEGRSGFTLDDLFGSSLFARDPEVILGLQLVEDGFSRLHIFKARGRRGDIRTGQTLELFYSDDELFRRKADEAERDLRAELTQLGSDHAWRTLKEWKAKPGLADADRAAPSYVELRGGIGAAEAKVKAALGELQVEEILEYAEGPVGRAPTARCWRLRPGASGAQGTPGQSGQLGPPRASADATAPLTPTPKGSAVVQGSSPSSAPEAEGTFGSDDPDEWADRIRELGLDKAGGKESG